MTPCSSWGRQAAMSHHHFPFRTTYEPLPAAMSQHYFPFRTNTFVAHGRLPSPALTIERLICHHQQTDTLSKQTHCQYRHLVNTDTLSIQTPCEYRHLVNTQTHFLFKGSFRIIHLRHSDLRVSNLCDITDIVAFPALTSSASTQKFKFFLLFLKTFL